MKRSSLSPLLASVDACTSCISTATGATAAEGVDGLLLGKGESVDRVPEVAWERSRGGNGGVDTCVAAGGIVEERALGRSEEVPTGPPPPLPVWVPVPVVEGELAAADGVD